MKCGPGLCIINGPADPGLYPKRHRKIFFVANLVHRHDCGSGRFRRQPEAVPAVSECRCAFERAPAAASHDNWDWDVWAWGKDRVRVADVFTVKVGRVAFEQFA